jgi:hypothetical protein
MDGTVPGGFDTNADFVASDFNDGENDLTIRDDDSLVPLS